MQAYLLWGGKVESESWISENFWIAAVRDSDKKKVHYTCLQYHKNWITIKYILCLVFPDTFMVMHESEGGKHRVKR